MKKILLLALAISGCFTLGAQTLKSTKIENGGTGPYKAIVTTEKGLENFTVYRPENMFTAANSEKKLPVILFGNGGCADSSRGFENFLTELASYGYFVIAIGPMPDFNAPRQQPQQQVSSEEMKRIQEMMAKNTDPQAPANYGINPEGKLNKQAPQRLAALELLKALDVVKKLSKQKGNPLYKSINTKKVIAMGQSCGGSQALVLGTCGDKRIVTTVCLNSGVTSPGDMLSDVVIKSDLKNLKGSIAYLEGGPSDLAQKNGLDDYKRITKVPVVMCNYDAGHSGTYREPHGGAFAKMARAWLDWQVKGKDNSSIFRKNKLKDYPGWTVESKNFKD